MNGAEVLGEIDIDSDQPAAFGPADRELLEQVAACSPKPRRLAGVSDGSNA